MQLNSGFFQALADVLRLIESLNVSSDQYGVLDAGQTLELSIELYTQIKDSFEFQSFEEKDGCWYCYNDDSWEVAS